MIDDAERFAWMEKWISIFYFKGGPWVNADKLKKKSLREWIDEFAEQEQFAVKNTPSRSQ